VSDLRLADVGVGQGSALSPVLSALFIAPIMKLFKLWAIRLGTTLLSYVDDGTAITQSKSLDDNNVVLKQAYVILFTLFEALGLFPNMTRLNYFTLIALIAITILLWT